MVVAEVRIELKKGVADPEGANTRKALELLGFKGIEGVSTVRLFEIKFAERDTTKVKAQVEEMCKRLLANPVIQSYRIDIR
ncbi:MAG: phosphoribosylformylglycinamidine synthase subunit PurS [Euryarchaeota archaeon]|nr:phosphoribosylformylglycinamidine synthase subunit PurS [Euryarchaeota archaeon]